MKQRSKLSLKKVRISNLSPNEMNNITGGQEGFLSIGENCSIDNSCSRMSRRGDLRCSDCQGFEEPTPADPVFSPGTPIVIR